jgi:hypothetical protein
MASSGCPILYGTLVANRCTMIASIQDQHRLTEEDCHYLRRQASSLSNFDSLVPQVLNTRNQLTCAAPRSIRPYISAGERTTHSESPSTKTPFFLSSRIVRLVRSGFSRSLITCISRRQGPFCLLDNRMFVVKRNTRLKRDRTEASRTSANSFICRY